MSKPRVSHYLRFRDLISNSTSSSTSPDALDECRLQNVRAMKEMLDYVELYDEADEDETVDVDPGTVDTTNLPPLE